MACASGYGERVTTRRMRRRVRGRFYWRVCKGVLHTGNVRKNKIKLWREDSREAWTIIGGWVVSGEHCRLKCDGFETAVDVKWISQRLPADNNYGILLQQTKKQQKQLKHSNHSRTIGSSVKPTAKRVGGGAFVVQRNAEVQATAQRKLRVSTMPRCCQHWQYLAAPTAATATTRIATTAKMLTMPPTRTSTGMWLNAAWHVVASQIAIC